MPPSSPQEVPNSCVQHSRRGGFQLEGGGVRVSARVGPKFTTATGLPAAVARFARRKADQVVRVVPSTNRPSLSSMAWDAASVTGLGMVPP